MRYYFDTLPLHPPPGPLESLTSYLTRLAELNYIYHPYAILSNFLGKTTNQADYAPVSFGRMPFVAACEEACLLRTTFYHLVKKFGCKGDPIATEHFLRGTLSQGLRYCPRCVEEHGYYSLIWRFLCLPGCVEHGCWLVDRCGHCGQALPLFTAPLKIGFCPKCKGNLRTCLAEQMPQRETLVTQTRFRDLEFLLTPHPCEDSAPQLLASLGWQYAQLRQKKQLRQVDVDTQLGFQSVVALKIEHGAVLGTRSLPNHRLLFQRYIKYADLLNVSFLELFTNALCRKTAGKEPEANNQQSQVKGIQCQKRDHYIQYALHEPVVAEFSNHSVLQLRVREEKASSLGGLGQEVLSTSSEQNGFIFHEGTIKPWGMHEQEWLSKILSAYEQLTARRERVTVKAICQIVPMATTTLGRYPRIKSFLASVIKAGTFQAGRRKEQLREETLIAGVHRAVAFLKAEGRLVTQAAIAELVHLTVKRLRVRPTVRVLLDQVLVEERHAQAMLYEEGIRKQMLEAIRLLESQGKSVTQLAVGEILHCRVLDLTYRHPQIKALWQEINFSRSSKKRAQRKKREEQILGQVHESINLLQLQEKPVTATAIAKLIGMSVTSLKTYQQVALLLDSVIQSNRTHKKNLRY